MQIRSNPASSPAASYQIYKLFRSKSILKTDIFWIRCKNILNHNQIKFIKWLVYSQSYETLQHTRTTLMTTEPSLRQLVRRAP